MRSIVVIGAGVGGYVAAIRAAQLGAKVTLIEKNNIGGTCLNEGCIPTKVLLHTAQLYSELLAGDQYGLKVNGDISVDWQTLQKRKKDVIKQLVGGIRILLQHNKIETINGTAQINSLKSVSVIKSDGQVQKIDADNIIVAVGTEPFIPPIPGADSPGVITSTEALNLDEVPKSITIVGGGVIGVEFAHLFKTLGAEVSIVEMMPDILPKIDGEVVSLMRAHLENKNIRIYSGAKVASISKNGSMLDVNVETKDGPIILKSEKVLMAAGRRGRLEGLNIEAIGIKTQNNFIVVNDNMETNVPGIYAIGDITGKNMLAHVASEQGIIAAESIMGLKNKMDYKVIPSCIYTNPEIASVGMTEEEAKSKGIDYKKGVFPLMANGKSIIYNETSGFVKIIADSKYGEVLGVHIIGPRATDMIGEAALAIKLEATIDELISTIHAHPTVSESIKEAALSVKNEAIHNINN